MDQIMKGFIGFKGYVYVYFGKLIQNVLDDVKVMLVLIDCEMYVYYYLYVFNLVVYQMWGVYLEVYVIFEIVSEEVVIVEVWLLVEMEVVEVEMEWCLDVCDLVIWFYLFDMYVNLVVIVFEVNGNVQVFE